MLFPVSLRAGPGGELNSLSAKLTNNLQTAKLFSLFRFAINRQIPRLVASRGIQMLF